MLETERFSPLYAPYKLYSDVIQRRPVVKKGIGTMNNDDAVDSRFHSARKQRERFADSYTLVQAGHKQAVNAGKPRSIAKTRTDRDKAEPATATLWWRFTPQTSSIICLYFTLCLEHPTGAVCGQRKIRRTSLTVCQCLVLMVMLPLTKNKELCP